MKADKTANVFMYIAGLAFNIAIMVLVGFLIIRAFDWGYAMGADIAEDMVYVGPNEYVEFVIPHDMSPSDVSVLLEEQGIIPNRHLFMLEMSLRSISNYYRAGTFTLNLSMNSVEINRTLRARELGLAPHETITVLEGWTIRDMAAHFEYLGFFTAEEFIFVAQYGHFPHVFLLEIPVDRPNRLEGFLFPDTYQVPLRPTPGCIITRMLDNFNRQFTSEFHERMEEMGMTLDEVIIKASIIEREAIRHDERARVSQVIHRRVEHNWFLGMCSTVKYGMDDPPDHLLNHHIQENNHPWNTYLNRGLPPSPISNPARWSIEAALWPANTTYMFFVLRNPETGEHHFSHTEAEHNAAAWRYGVGTRGQD